MLTVCGSAASPMRPIMLRLRYVRLVLRQTSEIFRGLNSLVPEAVAKLTRYETVEAVRAR